MTSSDVPVNVWEGFSGINGRLKNHENLKIFSIVLMSAVCCEVRDGVLGAYNAAPRRILWR